MSNHSAHNNGHSDGGPDAGLDDLLRRLADAASSSSRPLAPEEVRRRGSNRRTRRTVAGSLAAAVALAGIGTAAFRGAGEPEAGTDIAAPVTSTSAPGPVPSAAGSMGPSSTVGPGPGASRSAMAAPVTTPGSSLPPTTTPADSGAPTATLEPGSSSVPGNVALKPPTADPRGPGPVAGAPPPPPRGTPGGGGARAAMLTADELPAGGGFQPWVSSDQTFSVNCAHYTIPGHTDVTREDRYSTDGARGYAWQEILLADTDAEAKALYDSRTAEAGACSPSNDGGQKALPGTDEGGLYFYTTACKAGVTTCGQYAFVVGVARIQNVVVYVQFSDDEDIDTAAAQSAIESVVARVSASSLVT
jgi:hypothetical protein